MIFLYGTQGLGGLFLLMSLFAISNCESEIQSNSTTLPDTVNTQKPIYTIISPSKIRSNSNYHVSFQLANASKPVNVEIQISTNSSPAESIHKLSSNFVVNPFETKIQNLKIDELPNDDYKLIVKGWSEELNITHESNLKFESKSYSIFVQTDKAIYKPGQAVKFRVIIVNPSLLPIENRLLDIYIKDSKDNLIKQWKRVSPQLGIFSSELKLSEQPPLGDWSIVVDLQNQKYKKAFSIAEYVLPTFSVDIQLPPYATYNRSDVVATVKATYTYGRPVKGECLLTVKRYNRYLYQLHRPMELFQTKMTLTSDGSVDIPINIVRDLQTRSETHEQEIEFLAVVEETLTGKKYSKTDKIKIYNNDVKVELIKVSKTFKPGLKYNAFLKVTYQDGQPVEDSGPAVKINSGYAFNELNWSNVLEAVPVKGIVPIEVYPPKNNNITSKNIYLIEFRAEYRGKNYSLGSVADAQSPSNSFIQVISKNSQTSLENLFRFSSAQIGENVTFQVNATEPLQSVVYEIMAKGNIVLSGTVSSTGSNTTTLDITIRVTREMAPDARILVYYVREQNREIVVDALNFKVNGIFQTPIQLSSNVNQTKPGGRVDISVQTNPSAYVGLLGVDQSILLLKAGNDITRNEIIQDLQSYDGIKKNNQNFPRRWGFMPSFGSGATAGEIFDNSGLTIFTNALLNREVHFNLEAIPVSALGSMLKKRPMNSSVLKPSQKPPKTSEQVRLRQKFPETWIWTNISAGSDGIAKYSDIIPDTITSWHISAFAMDGNTGLGIAEDNLKISVFRPFFIKLSLPYSIIRGESVSLHVLLFNYQNKPVTAEVLMQNDKDEFDFVSLENEIENQTDDLNREKRKTISIPALDGVSVYFTITPKILGNIDIKVKAICENAGDAIVRKLLVKPEGQTQYFNKAMFVKLDTESANTIKKNFSIEIPQNAVPGSVRVKVSGISDILGPTVNHIDDLLRMPYGCGEQNMINLVPNIVVLNYLSRVKRLTPSIKNKAINHISSGYQRELTYRRNDGSFSAFGQRDKAGSTWLTAFVLKSFIQARPYIDVDQSVLDQAIKFLFSQQNKDGSFAENGEVHHKALQGGAAVKHADTETNLSHGNAPNISSNDSAGPLTAYVLIAILHETNSTKSLYNESIKQAENYIFGRLSNSNNPYEISIIAQALYLSDSEHRQFAYNKLLTLTKREDGLSHWQGKADLVKPQNVTTSLNNKIIPVSDYLSMPDSLEVETTAYALLTLMNRADLDNGIPTLRWLISKQNSNGGFASTQDTVIGLQALGSIAEKISNSELKLSVSVESGNTKNDTSLKNAGESLEFNSENSLVLQQIDLKPSTESVELTATGLGSAIVQVSYQYNIGTKAEKPAFFLIHQSGNISTENNMQMSICTFYKDGNSTNMAVMEIELPSGYNADLEALPSIMEIDGVKRAETANNDGTINIYFDQITQNETCIPIVADRTHRVTNNKPVPITIYDYYDRSKLSRIFYELTSVNESVSKNSASVFPNATIS